MSFANKVSPTLASHQTTRKQRAAIGRGKTTIPCAYQSEVDCLKILCNVHHVSSCIKPVKGGTTQSRDPMQQFADDCQLV
jgi:hypothetical protein